MARPKKQTVDYFPHYCNGSRSLAILQNQHGNDGYAFWFKLLQLLGRSEGHFFDYNNTNDWLFLVTETHVTEAQAEKMLETLAGVGSIDKELWQKKIIWSQHFVDNVADVYVRRQASLPQRPGSPLPERPLPVVAAGAAKVDSMIEYYQEQLGKTLTPMDYEKVKDFADNYPDGWFEKAVDEAKKNNARSPMNYIGKIMETWIKEDKPPEQSTDNQGMEEM